MENRNSLEVLFLWSIVISFTFAHVLIIPLHAFASHNLRTSPCYDCHVVGSSLSDILDQSRLIQKDAKVSEIQANGWGPVGSELPCAYCHDDTPRTVRENMIGVKDDFTAASLSRHPVNPFTSKANLGQVGDGSDGPNNLDCVDCHLLAAVDYLGRGGTTPGTNLSPNIHEQSTGSVAWTPDPGLLVASDTLVGGSHLNSDSNVFCTSRCHDASFTDYNSGQVLHSYSGTLVSLELSVGGAANSPAGCLYEGGSNSDGCHGVHNVANNTDLVAARKSNASIYGTGYIQRTDCGICHIFDDPGPPSFTRSDSEWIKNGHGRFETTNGIECTSCHDASIPHFQADGSPVTGSSEGRLNFVLDANSSGFSSPPKSETSICVSSNCHSGKSAHGDVGCLDCHDPHGHLVDGNTAMIRRTPPVASPASSLNYANQGDWYNSTSPPAPGNYSNYVCDQEDCHGGTGPGPYVDLMADFHPDVVTGCDNCHLHGSGGGSFTTSCDTCHGGTTGADANGYWPDTGSRGDDDTAGSPDDIGAHLVHIQALAQAAWGEGVALLLTDNGNGTADSKQRTLCRYCHPDRTTDKTGSGDHTGGDDAETAANNGDYPWTGEFLFVDGSDLNDDGDFSTYASPTCANVDCHNNITTPVWYSAPQTGNARCTVCHSGITVHVDGGGTDGCMDCHPGGSTNPNKHTAAGNTDVVTVPLPPLSWDEPASAAAETWNMRTRLGIEYAFGGIHLGGENTNGNTEAEICWNCHDGAGVSEWGYNTKTNVTMTGFSVVWSSFPTQNDGTAESRNYGWIYQNNYTTKVTDWTAGYWMSQYDALLKRRIASVHTVSFDAAGQSSSVGSNVVSGSNKVRQGTGGNPSGDTSNPILEGRDYIRCSYCHDVHDTVGPDGGSFLRGAWVGDPYPPELPPRSSYTYTKRINQLETIYTPRALSTARDRGGYFIDQNSGRPTTNAAMDTLAETAGLCTLCHGTDVDNMDFYTSSSLWRFAPPGKNGHSNAVLGGTRDAALISDLFTAARYGHDMGMQQIVPRSPWVCSDIQYDCDPNYPLSTFSQWKCETDCGNLRNSGWFNTIATNTTTPKGGDFANWYGTGTIGAGTNVPGTKAHEFTCSKCHSPHASGLPALLIQNCIDPSLGSFTINAPGSRTFTGTNLIANNCHRKTTTADGWHILAPGQ